MVKFFITVLLFSSFISQTPVPDVKHRMQEMPQ